MHLLCPEDFDAWVGRQVRVETVPQPIEVTLQRVARAPRLAPEIDFREPFSLFFESPRDVMLLDGTYRFDCGQGGPHDIYITQLHPTATHRVYQAVFN
ncbi:MULTISPECIES: DUF6916 family protein [unclassified Sphingomonas]|uniref:DUF6916 family protein n=1 Tax=unclassified Sphingomonas TaxID=196159 RepID=UPI000E108352|nr:MULTISPECIES: hypothetical protein [unclassified Sphingomonas]AXJ95437.1 hypothetical protein DM480_07830 [Sphingomonas sp. FARSPH]